MGADLYINKLYETNKKKWKPAFDAACKARSDIEDNDPRVKKAQKAVDRAYEKMYSVGYFRDSYNCWNVLNRLGYSWWVDVSKLLNKKRNMSVANARKFRNMVANAKFKPFSEKDLKVWNISPKDMKDSEKYFVQCRKELLEFLSDAIKMKQPIYCSL